MATPSNSFIPFYTMGCRNCGEPLVFAYDWPEPSVGIMGYACELVEADDSCRCARDASAVEALELEVSQRLWEREANP